MKAAELQGTATMMPCDVAQVGDVFKACFPLPLEIEGKFMTVVVEGVGEAVRAKLEPTLVEAIDLGWSPLPVR